MSYCFYQFKFSRDSGSTLFKGSLRLFSLFGILIPLVSDAATTLAESGHYRFGYELQVYREGVLPSPFHILSLGADYQNQTPDSKTEVDFTVSFSPENFKVWSFEGKNLYWSHTLGSDTGNSAPRLSLGRKERMWSVLDSLWNLGLVQPINQWDRFRPVQQGLTGLFLDFSAGPIEFHLFGTYFMYPETIPNVVIENGAFQHFHPESVSSTPETITILNQSRPLVYSIEYPSISEVAFRPGVMASLGTSERNPLLLQVSYGYKPQNYFSYALRGYLSIPNNEIDIFIKPRLLMHQVITADLGYRMQVAPVSFGVSGISDLPGQDSISSDYTYAPQMNSLLVSPWIKFWKSNFHFSISQILWNGGVSSDVGAYASPGASVISSHVFYRNATQVQFGFSLPFLGPGTRAECKWVHEYELTADWMSGDFFIPFKTALGDLMFTAGGDLVQSALNSNPNGPGGEFLVDMRVLDRVRMGVRIAI